MRFISFRLTAIYNTRAVSICVIFSVATGTFENILNCLSIVKKSKFVIIRPYYAFINHKFI